MSRRDLLTTHTFIVEGTGRFPIDMLRYDQCWPKHQADATLLCARREDPVRIVLETWKTALTVDRWKSFGWTVI